MQCTRLWAGFSNVPPNVSISVSGTASNGVGDTAWLVPNAGTDGSGGTPAASGTTAITLSGGAGYATWELVGSNAATVGSLTFTVYVSYGSNPLPGLGTANVAGNYAPVTTIFTSSGPAPEPRFVINPQSATTFTITSCQTNLLFPFVTNQAGFDTGVVLSNTSLDPYGTAPQTGACTLYYYGGTPNGGAAPPSQTSASITGGQQIVFTLSAGNAAQGVVATPGFQGYLIARCNFQYGHGFAFISDLGASKLAEGYLALVLDEDKDTMSGTTRTGTASETNRH